MHTCLLSRGGFYWCPLVHLDCKFPIVLFWVNITGATQTRGCGATHTFSFFLSFDDAFGVSSPWCMISSFTSHVMSLGLRSCTDNQNDNVLNFCGGHEHRFPVHWPYCWRSASAVVQEAPTLSISMAFVARMLLSFLVYCISALLSYRKQRQSGRFSWTNMPCPAKPCW